MVQERHENLMAARSSHTTNLSMYFNVHLVSDSTGETLNAVMRAAAAQFERVQPLEHNYYLVRSAKQLARVLAEIKAAPGVVWYTVSDEQLRTTLEHECRAAGIPTLAVLDPAVHMLSRHLGVVATERVAGQHSMTQQYFDRIEAVDFALRHDDGQNTQGLTEADVVLVGVSRTSKTPTCVYLANRGVRAGNVPLVPGVPPPPILMELRRPLVVGLKISAERLVQIRRQRLLSLHESPDMSYADEANVQEEVTQANRLYQRNKWVVIDVSRKSVEETAAAILNKLNERRGHA